MLADINCHCKMMPVMALDCVMLFLNLKGIKTVQLLARFLHCHGEKLEEAEDLVYKYFMFKSKVIETSRFSKIPRNKR